MIHVLHVVSVMDIGGMESFIMNVYRQLDRSEIQFDFLVHHKRRGAFEDEIERLGGTVHHTSVLDDGNLLRYRRQLRKLFQKHPEYRIVHGHLGSMALWYLKAAAEQGVPWRILHSHCPGHIHSLKGDIKHVLFQFSPRYANVRLACSETAGRYQFHKQDFEVIPNGIAVDNFLYREEVRNSLRAQYGLEGHLVLGHVGRFYYEKNHAFLLKIFQAVQRERPDAVLLLIGDGLLREETEKLAESMNLKDSVRFLGLQKNTAPFYQAMDAFLLPSLYEALPLVGIEAQCAGLPCFFSEGVSCETALGSNCWFFSIGDGMEKDWAKAILDSGSREIDRTVISESLRAFDVRVVAESLRQRYIKMSKGKP